MQTVESLLASLASRGIRLLSLATLDPKIAFDYLYENYKRLFAPETLT
jgi:hypothetical protein